MYIGEPFSWKPAAFEGSNGIMSVTTKETTAHGRACSDCCREFWMQEVE